MKDLLSNLKISVQDKIYIKDPETSQLGKRIIENSIVIINEIGFESFTFKKLGNRIGSNESSIYRYFESKHKLLLYLSSWYWAWLEYQLVLETFSISNSKEKLEKAITILTRTVEEDSNFTHINEVLLYKIIVNESSKSFLTKEVDNDNKEGYSDYKFALSLASTIIEGGLHQHFLNNHFPSITNCDNNKVPTKFFLHLVFHTLNKDND